MLILGRAIEITRDECMLSFTLGTDGVAAYDFGQQHTERTTVVDSPETTQMQTMR